MIFREESYDSPIFCRFGNDWTLCDLSAQDGRAILW